MSSTVLKALHLQDQDQDPAAASADSIDFDPVFIYFAADSGQRATGGVIVLQMIIVAKSPNSPLHPITGRLAMANPFHCNARADHAPSASASIVVCAEPERCAALWCVLRWLLSKISRFFNLQSSNLQTPTFKLPPPSSSLLHYCFFLPNSMAKGSQSLRDPKQR